VGPCISTCASAATLTLSRTNTASSCQVRTHAGIVTSWLTAELTNMFPSEEVIVGVKCPTLIVHGVMDQVMEGTSVRKGQMKRGAKARNARSLSLSLSCFLCSLTHFPFSLRQVIPSEQARRLHSKSKASNKRLVCARTCARTFTRIESCEWAKQSENRESARMDAVLTQLYCTKESRSLAHSLPPTPTPTLAGAA